MPLPRPAHLATVCAVLLALVLGGCGSDADPEPTDPTTPSTTVVDEGTGGDGTDEDPGSADPVDGTVPPESGGTAPG